MTEPLTVSQLNFLRAITKGIYKEFARQEVLTSYHLGTASNMKRLKDSLLQKNLIDISNSLIIFLTSFFVIGSSATSFK